MLAWLLEAGVGPAAVALPVNWAAGALASAAQRWFRRLRRTDDLSRLVKAATGNSIDLTEAEFAAVRKLLEDQHTWSVVGGGTVDDLADQIAGCLQPRSDQTVEGSHAAALVIARGLIEFAVADLDSRLFQQVLLARLQRIESDQASALDYALLSLHGRFGSMMEQLKLVLERLPPGPAGQAEITVYLRTLVDWLSVDPWPRDFGAAVLTPTVVERKLLVTVTSQVEDEEEVEADGLAQRCTRLVILGGPGSGKTWLARRTARRCAEAAVEALAAGGRLDEVELPLYITCSHLFSAEGDIREATVSSALNQIGDLGGSRVKAALSEFFVERNAPVLLVIDALDEAHGSSERLRQADTLPWRIVVTSRPSSWKNQLAIDDTDESRQVGELQPLLYPDDVAPFIRHWFGGRSEGSDLVEQIARRPDLQQAATVPLMLAFYCIVGSGGALPELRRHLYTKVLRRMLTGRWHDDDDERHVDTDACLAVLRAWAWSGAISAPVSGIGAWKDDIPTGPVWLDKPHRDALDHIATPIGSPDFDSGKTARRFIHRSVREHLVAEYVARLPADEAAEVLLPHLWYDPDWEYAAPAAIAMHPDHDQLLRRLIYRAAGADRLPGDLSVIDARWEFRSLLARIAAESSETDWSPEIAAMIGQARVDLASALHTEDLGGTVGWQISSSQACEALLALLTSRADSYAAADVVDGLVQLAVGAEERRQVREALLDLLVSTTGGGRIAHLVVDGLVQLAVGAEERRKTREVLLDLLASETRGHLAAKLADGLGQLDPGPDEKRHIREVLMALLVSHSDSEMAELLVEQLVRFDPGPEKGRVREVVLALLSDPPGWTAEGLVDGMVQLAVGAEERRKTREVLLDLLASETRGHLAAELADGLAQLDPGPEDKRQAREVLLGLLAGQTDVLLAVELVRVMLAWFDPGPEQKRQAWETLLALLARQPNGVMMAELMDGLAHLDPGAAEKRQAREVLLALLGHPKSTMAAELLDGLAQMDPGLEDKRQAREALLGLLAGETGGLLAADLATGLARLDPGPEEKRQAREVLLALLSHVKSWMAAGLVDGLVRLTTAPEEKRQVSEGLLALLARQTGSRMAADLASGVARLDPGPEEKQQARQFLLAMLTRQNGGRAAERLIDPLMQLGAGKVERWQARDAMLRLLAEATTPKTAERAVSGLARLTVDAEERLQVRGALLAMLASQSNSKVATKLADGLSQLAPVAHDLDNWRAWAVRPSLELLAAVRGNSELTDWLLTIPSLNFLSATR